MRRRYEWITSGRDVSRFHASAASNGYIQDLLSRYQSTPSGVPPDWRTALDLITAYFPHALAPQIPSGWDAQAFVRRFAHLAAEIDPLRRPLPEAWDRLRNEFLERLGELSNSTSLGAIASGLEHYAGTLAVETGHIDDPRRVAWIEARRETAVGAVSAARRRALQAVVHAEAFERFMGVRFVGKKRFGAEGSESLHALISHLFERAAAAGTREVVIGTMHRGRLGLMANLLGQSIEQMFARMKGGYPLAETGQAADVPYHMGLTTVVRTSHGDLTIRLLPNPSHLEAINSVALGFARRRQEIIGSVVKVMPLILHTDASVIGQGVVAEGIQFAELPGYSVGGAIHVIVNNQLGFTTEPHEGRSSRHCTGQWKAVDSLITHANGNDVDAVIRAVDLCVDYRRDFGGESVIDLVCVRRNGHNELDEPRFTQPGYYNIADTQPDISAIYAETLLKDKAIATDFVAHVTSEYLTQLEAMYSRAEGDEPKKEPEDATESAPFAPLDSIAQLASVIPEGGDFHPKAARVVSQRQEELRTGVSWGTAELFALGSILSAGWDIRFTGEDVDRGAFSQRHLSLIDATSGRRRQIFDARPAGWGVLKVHNSPLSEYAALAFEYGFSLSATRTLTIWEAQFGDFANVAQAVFDQFISSGYEKWGQRSGLITLLPHGLEGQGPEHSSARIERMLHLAARSNMRIAHPSTSASYFHLLRSQIREHPQRPLIVFTPKKLLRLKPAMSPRVDFESAYFEPVIVDASSRKSRRVILCSGKLYYDLVDGLARRDETRVTLIRLEQLYPFPIAEVAQALRSAAARDIVWVQEEPENYGAWSWVRSHIERAMSIAGISQEGLRRVSRPECASPAGSFHKNHEADQLRLVDQATEVLDRAD